MLLKFDPDDFSDRKKLTALLENHGIYFECDLFDHAHLIIDTIKLRESFRNSSGKTRKIDDSIRAQAIRMKENGMTIRQISSELSVSIGTVFNLTKDNKF